MVSMNERRILGKGDVQKPMQLVFDAPMAPRQAQKELGLRLQAADIIRGLRGGFFILCPGSLHADKGTQGTPFTMPIKNWGMILDHLSIYFGDRVELYI